MMFGLVCYRLRIDRPSNRAWQGVDDGIRGVGDSPDAGVPKFCGGVVVQMRARGACQSPVLLPVLKLRILLLRRVPYGREGTPHAEEATADGVADTTAAAATPGALLRTVLIVSHGIHHVCQQHAQQPPLTSQGW